MLLCGWQWLGNDGEIIVELPGEGEELAETDGGDPTTEEGATGKLKAKAKAHRFTAVK